MPEAHVLEGKRGGTLSILGGALFALAAAPFATACLSSNSKDEPKGEDAPSWVASGGSDSGSASGGDGSSITVPPQGMGGEMSKCDASPEADQDGDGFTGASGDCNDCNANTNPGAFDLPDNGVDEDCDGVPDNSTKECDDSLVEGMDARSAARALGICRDQEGESWGLIEAKWVYPDGTELSSDGSPDKCNSLEVGVPPAPESHGILENFGPNVSPLEGKRLLALSTGVARAGTNKLANGSTSPSGGRQCRVSATPPGFPKDSPSCAPVTTADDTVARDAVALELTIKAPTNATQFSFGLDFYTYEFPTYVCSRFNDFFVALLASEHEMIPGDQNVSFDAKGNPISVNNALVEICEGPVEAGDLEKPFDCSLGTTELMGTGFDLKSNNSGDFHAAATGWLTTAAPIVPGEIITLRFAIWDTGDEILDSTILLDDFKWSAEPGSPDGPTTVRPH